MSGIVGGKNHRGSGLIANLGSDGEVLTSAGAGLRQVFEAAGGGGAWNFIDTVVASNSGTIAVTGIDATYEQYVVIGSDLVPENNGKYGYLRLGDSGGVDSGASDYSWACWRGLQAFGDPSNATVGTYDGDSTAAEMHMGSNQPQAGSGSGQGMGFFATLYNPRGDVFPTISGNAGSSTHESGTVLYTAFAGNRLSLITTDRVEFHFSDGDVTSGRMTVWGIAHA